MMWLEIHLWASCGNLLFRMVHLILCFWLPQLQLASHVHQNWALTTNQLLWFATPVLVQCLQWRSLYDVTNVALTIDEAIHMYDFHLKSIYWHVFMVLLLGMISMDVRNLEGTDTMQTLFNHCSCQPVVVCWTSLLRKLVCFGVSAILLVFFGNALGYSCTALVIVNRHHAWVSFEATAEVYNEVNRATSNENANHLEQYLSTYPLRKFEAEEGM